MEVHQFQTFPFLLSILFFIFLVLRILGKKNSTKNLPPGPWKLPLIGSLHHLITSLPHHRLRDLAEIYGPIMHLQLGELTNIVISSPEAAKEVMKTHDIAFAQRPFILAATDVTYNFSDIAFAPYGDYWRQIRKICTVELLTAKRVESFRSVREEQVSDLIASISSNAGGSSVNFSMMVNSSLYSITSRTAFGKIWEGKETFIPTIKALLAAAGGFSLADLYPSVKLLQVLSGMSTRLKRLINVLKEKLEQIRDPIRENPSSATRNEGE